MAGSAVIGDSAGGQGGQLPAALDLCHVGGCGGTDPARQKAPGGRHRAKAGGKFCTEMGILKDATKFPLLSCCLY